MKLARRAGAARPAADARFGPRLLLPLAALLLAGQGVAARPNPIAALYTSDLGRAVAGAKKVPFRGTGPFGGMTCSPTRISGKTAASRALTLTLPAAATMRRHVLAVVTPERGLMELYTPYDEAGEAEDLVIPSRAISWVKARTRSVFVTSADALDGLRSGATLPEALFVEPGRYRFALVNGVDAKLLAANGRKVKVWAACSFDWTP